MKIFIANLTRGKSHPEWETFYMNLVNLNAKSPDFAGINNMALFAHHQDISTVQMLVSDGIKKPQDIIIEEITADSFENDPAHALHGDLINGYFKFVTLV